MNNYNEMNISKTKEAPILRSRLKWWVNPLMVLSAIIVILIIWMFIDLLIENYQDSFWSVVSGARAFHRYRFLGYLISIPIFGTITLWYIRRITIFHDHVEVRFPLHKKWKYDIRMADVDCFCLEERLEETDNGERIINNIYLLSGRKLWLYASANDCSNYDEMLEVLENYFCIPERKGNIKLSKEEMSIVRHGGNIELEDISQEELTELSALRRQRRPSAATPWTKQSSSYKLTGRKKGLLFALVATILFGIIIISSYINLYKISSLPVIDATTTIPHKRYLQVDSIDIDPNGTLYTKSIKMKEKRITTFWAFHVKKRNDILIIMCVTMIDKDNIPANAQRVFCSNILKRNHKYEIIRDKKYIKKVLKHINRRINGDKTTIILNYNDRILEMGSAVFTPIPGTNSIASYAKSEYSNAITPALCGDAICANKLGIFFQDKDKDEAIKWYEIAAKYAWYAKQKAGILNNMSYIYSSKGEYDKAICIIDSAIKVNPHDANLYDSRGEHLYFKGEKDSAQAMWNKVISMDPVFLRKYNSNLWKLLNKEH